LRPLRKFSLTLHLWLGLFAAILLFVEGVTGGIMAWDPRFFGFSTRLDDRPICRRIVSRPARRPVFRSKR
jgi:site-specific recombinase